MGTIDLRRFLREEGFEVEEADDGATALELLKDERFDLMICDVVMPRMTASDVIRHMRSLSLSVPMILISGHPESLHKNGLATFPSFAKPFNMYDLLRKVKEFLEST